MSGSARWPTVMIGRLCELKAEGLTFDRAWTLALREHVPRGRDFGDYMPTLWRAEESSLVEFTREVCWNAWHDVVSTDPGQGKALGRFTPTVLAAMDDSSEPAGRSFRQISA